jgi:hypothetical protein
LDTDLYTVLRTTAANEDIPVSYVIRRALRKGLGLPKTSEQSPQTKDTTAEIATEWE